MANFVVTTLDDADLEDPDGQNDGFLSLREAVAMANASADADIITFDPTIVGFYRIDNGAIEIATGSDLTIIGDLDDDGITDVAIQAGLNHHFTVEAGATLNLTGIDLVGGNSSQENVPAGAAGEWGTRGENGFSDLNVHGTIGGDATAGSDAMPGEPGLDRPVQAGAIINFGTLNLTRVGFGGNEAIGGIGGNGGNGGLGGQGGEGGSGTLGLKWGGSSPPPRSISGGDGGDGADGGNGGDGGHGGNGGTAGGAIYNGIGAAVTLKDVVFGGTLTYLGISHGNRAHGGYGGLAGEGGGGGVGGDGGDGGDAGYWDEFAGPPPEATGTPGNGGNAGDGGNAGLDGQYGRSGDAAGGILNDGTVMGAAAFAGNSATSSDMSKIYEPGFTAAAGRGGDGGSGGDGLGGSVFVPDGADGLDGIDGAPSAPRIPSDSGETDASYLDRNGTSSIASGSILVYAHGLELEGEESAEFSFNLIRLGSQAGDVSVRWELRSDGPNGIDADDFGGTLPSGEIVMEAQPDDAPSPLFFATAARTVTFAAASDVLAEGAENFVIIITGASVTGAENVVLGTSQLNGMVLDADDPRFSDGDDVVTLGDEGESVDAGDGNDMVTGGNGDDTILGGAGNDTLNGGDGDDRLDGQDGDDVLDGGPGDDDGTLIGGAGDDTLDGGDGFDVAEYAGSSNDFTITDSGGGNFIVTDNNPGDGLDEGTDTLTRIEAIHFLGNDVTFDLTGSQNNAPVGTADAVAARQDRTATYAAAALLANDSDFEGDVLTVTAVSSPVNGTVSLDGTTITFTPTAGFTGDASFAYTVSDGNGGAATAMVSVTVSPPPPPIRIVAGDGAVISIGGNGDVFGTNFDGGAAGRQDITFVPPPAGAQQAISLVPQGDAAPPLALDGDANDFDLDGSFGRGGDVLRFAGDAGGYTIAIQGVAAEISDGFSSYVLPIGTAGLVLVFDDGARTLAFDTGSGEVMLGSQTVTATPAQITAPDDGTQVPDIGNPDTVSRAVLFENAQALLGGTFDVFGTNDGAETVGYVSGDLALDGSFARGGDEVSFEGPAATYSAYLSGTSLILLTPEGQVAAPVGVAGLTLDFAGDERTLAFDAGAGQVMIGDQAITATTAGAAQALMAEGFA